MAITVEVDSNQYDGFIRSEVEITLDTISGRFSLTSSTLSQSISPFKVGQECIVRVDDVPVINGFIEQINIQYDNESHEIMIEGRDKTADLIDSSAPVNNEYQTDVSFKRIIETTLSRANITGIEVIDSVYDLEDFKKSDISSDQTGESVFEFLKSLAEKKQVFLTTDGIGNIVISRSDGTGLIENLISNPVNPNSNILSGSVVYESMDRFNKITVRSQMNTSGAVSIESFISGSNAVGQSRSSQDTCIRESRNLTILADKSYTATQLSERAKWEVNIRRISSKRYTCIVQGHSRPDKSGVWRPNQLVKIVDTFADIDDIMLINTVKFSVGLGDGRGERTELTFVERDAYKIQAKLPIAAQKSSNLGSQLNIC